LHTGGGARQLRRLNRNRPRLQMVTKRLGRRARAEAGSKALCSMLRGARRLRLRRKWG